MDGNLNAAGIGGQEKAHAPESCLSLYGLLLEANGANGWANPIFIANDGEHAADFFQVEVNDFLEIVGCPEVHVYRINKRWGTTMIYCRRTD